MKDEVNKIIGEGEWERGGSKILLFMLVFHYCIFESNVVMKKF